ncbi:hypothetical protein [Candidatus Cyanaurora vandensis]|uniref:endonuclease/exonuclease/phosphatase family protein n=1 Tax=Candidatus Cyanaurora vandensis TaxID=2714958 RepID=UPI00257EC678|nr:hypothetical protein [Candidatus Cyanaurora vandensis]
MQGLGASICQGSRWLAKSLSVFALVQLGLSSPVLAAPPGVGDLIINEYSSDNDANGADYLELLVLTDGLDLRGLRISDNELVAGVFNNNESVLVFGQDAYLSSVPKGTTLAIYTIVTGVTTDTITDPTASDWKLVLVPGTGITVEIDGLGGSINAGLSTGGEALYVYLPGADGTSAGTDNVYLDFVSFESDGGEPPAGFTDINLPSVADNGYYTGNTAIGNDTASNWVVYDGPPPIASATPGEANPSQDLAGLRGGIANAGIITSCPPTLGTSVGTATSTAISATDTDGTVTGIAITSTPVPGISLSAIVPATTLGGTATAQLDISASTALGNYSVVLTFTNNDPTPQTSTCTITVAVNPLAGTRIRDIQGAGHVSPLFNPTTGVGLAVTDVPGLVTAVRTNGFYFQDPAPDSDPNTAEGIFVFTGSAPTVTVGSSITVSGTVGEFRPGCSSFNCTSTSSGFANLSTTQIASPTITAVAPLGTVTATVIGSGGRVPPTEIFSDDATGTPPSVETGGAFDPASDGVDFYESLEGMLVRVNDARVVGPTVTFGAGGPNNVEVYVLGDNGANATGANTRGGINIRPNDLNPERIVFNNALQTLPEVGVGTVFPGAVDGVLDYSFGKFLFYPINPLPVPVSNPPLPEVAAGSFAGELTVAAFNVENLDPGDGTRYDQLASVIVNNLRSPDILNLEEIQDNNGPTNDGIVAADQTLHTLITAIQTAGGPLYSFRQVNPAPGNLDGGEPGGNIRVAFLYRADRVTFVDRYDGTSDLSTTATQAQNVGGPILSLSPGRVDPNNTAFLNSRKPLAGEFEFQGRKVFVVGNHFNSKGGDQPLFSRFQPPTLLSETQRLQQATVVKGFVDSILAIDPLANVIVLGDLNDFESSPPLTILKGTSLFNLVERVTPDDRFSFIFTGNAQVLDHLLSSVNLAAVATSQDFIHVNPEFVGSPTDHDPFVVRFDIPSTATQWRIATTGDLNSDGKVDILFRNRLSGDNAVWLLDGTTFLSAPLLDSVTDLNWRLEATGNFNSDTQVDLLWRNQVTGENGVWFMNGTTFVSGDLIAGTPDLNWEIVGTGDFNSDTKVDILWRNRATGENGVWLLDGVTFLGGFLIEPLADLNWAIVGTGDFNSDAKVDILYRNRVTGENAVWFLDGFTYLTGAYIPSVTDANWTIGGTADFNGDAQVDLLWRNLLTGENAVWLMNGITYLEAAPLPPTN